MEVKGPERYGDEYPRIGWRSFIGAGIVFGILMALIFGAANA
jgi:hypothetical protein